MFFHISKKFDYTFPNYINHNDYFIHFDNGWTYCENFLYKGITQKGVLQIKSKQDIDNYRNANGTFCIISLDSDKIEVIGGKKQKFPIYLLDMTISNTYTAGTNVTCPIFISNTNITESSTKDLYYTNLNTDDKNIINLLDDAISNYIKDFNSPTPIKIYPTGGVDTILLISYILKHDIPYDLVTGEHAEMDRFLCNHRNRLRKNYWAYSTIQHWKEPSILLTGAHGDETLLRDFLQAYLMLKYHDEDLVTVCTKNPQLYQSTHYLLPQCIEEYKEYSDMCFENENQLKSYILNKFKTDYQHWHLGNTLYFAPFDNIELLNLSLNLTWETARKQLLDAYVSKQLIQKNRPGLLRLISPLKNVDYYQNLSDIFDGIKNLEDL